MHYTSRTPTPMNGNQSPTQPAPQSLSHEAGAAQPGLALIIRLCQALASEGIVYCHWKSNDMIARSASGENDLDLLISRSDAARFTALLYSLGFKRAIAPPDKQMQAVQDYYGYDEGSGRLVHVHAHYQLIMGHDATKNFRLPIEDAYLASSARTGLFAVPAPGFELIVFVVRMVLKHATWDAILGREGSLKKAEQRELTYLLAESERSRVHELVTQHIPYIGVELFERCLRAIQPGCPIWERMRVGQELQLRLQSNARRPIVQDTILKIWRRGVTALRWRLQGRPARYRLEPGGAIIAIVGGDGAGKSTAIEGLHGWLYRTFDTTGLHLGKPDWSLTTKAIRFVLKLGQIAGLYPHERSFRATIEQQARVSPGYPFILREICRARDRHTLYVQARRLAADGGLVILDRFPLPQIQLMDGPQIRSFITALQASPQARLFLSPHPDHRLSQYLIQREERYYQQMTLPDIIAVLRVDPEIAVQRKTEESAESVRERSTEIWKIDWSQTPVYVVDASHTKAEVLAELKRYIWSRL